MSSPLKQFPEDVASPCLSDYYMYLVANAEEALELSIKTSWKNHFVQPRTKNSFRSRKDFSFIF